MNLSIFLLISVTGLRFILGVEEALIFNPETQQLNEIDQKSNFFNKCTSCIIACPASSKQQQSIIEEASITGNAIFLQAELKNGVENSKCEESFRPAIVQNTSMDLYETGYELFYPEEKIQLKCGKYKNFSKVKVIDNDEENKSKSSNSNANIIKKIEEEDNTKFEILGESYPKMVFYWISVLSIKLFEQGRQINFVKDVINDIDQRDRTMIICKDYNLGDELEKVPSEKWERFQNVDLKQLEIVDLEEIQIMPMRYFHTVSARLATCTYLNIAYVWKGIAASQYRKVDLFLYSMYRQWPNDTTIIFGIKGVSNEVTYFKLQKINFPENKILQKFPIPAPEIIYRIVELKQNEKINNVVVVFHNSLGSVPIGKRICPADSEVQGWNVIKPDPKPFSQYTEPSGLTYACPVTTDTMERLGAHYEPSSSMGMLTLNTAQQIKIMKYVKKIRAEAADHVDVE